MFVTYLTKLLEFNMTHVVTENCINCKFTDCVDVCPVDCFLEGPNFLIIDPDECIDCAICVPECPVNAIISEENTSKEQIIFYKVHKDLSLYKNIKKKKSSLPNADYWKSKKNKISYLQ